MGVPFKIRSIAVDTETSFGTPSGSSYSRITLASDISLSIAHEVHQYSPLREGNIVEDTFQKTTKAATTLMFKIPIHGFLQEGSAYSGSPATHQLADLLKHVLGASYNEAHAAVTPISSVIGADYRTSWFTSADFSGIVPGVYAQRCLDNDQQALQAMYCWKKVTSGSDSYLSSVSQRLDADGNTSTGAYATSSSIYSANVVYKTPAGFYPNSLSFEVAGSDSNDAYILYGCCGSVTISGESNGLAWAEFSFSCASWASSTKTGLTHDTSGVVYPHEHQYALPLPLTHGVAKLSIFSSSNPLPSSTTALNLSRFDIRCEPSIGAAVSLNSPDTSGIASWYRGDFTVSGSVTDYFSNTFRSFFTASNDEMCLSIQIGDQPGKSCCLIFRNILPTRFPDNTEIDGQSGLRLDFVAGFPKTQEVEASLGFESVLSDADFMIAFF